MICFLLPIQSLWMFVAASRQSHSAPDLNLVEKEHVSSLPRLDSSSSDDILRRIDAGSPFIIRSIANEWPATQKWNHNYFKRIFSSNDDLLVSSTFSTTPPPSTFSANETKKRETYYGIFLNDPILANLVADDYDLPSFIPGDWWLRGNEWLHWGWSPSGAQRHVDLMCSSRMSVQVRGQKRWKFYPLVNTSSTQYKDILKRWEGIVNSGDAVLWFPGWEHETKILGKDESVSLSLHFWPIGGTRYETHFASELAKRIPMKCQWKRG